MSFTPNDVMFIVAGVVLVFALLMGRRIEAKIGKIHFELNPNGGKTLRDAVDRLEARIEKLESVILPAEKNDE
jgi:hypothetical protein